MISAAKIRKPNELSDGVRVGLWIALALGFAAISAGARAASDFQWTFTANATIAYTLTSVSSNEVYMGTLPADNPTIALILGKRYGVTNVDYLAHPLEVVAKGSVYTGDVVLLSQGSSAGSLNADPGIAWSDTGTSTVEFTVTQTLIDAMRSGGNTPGYRCTVHPFSMRGDFAIYGDGVPIADPIPPKIPKGTITIDLLPVLTGMRSPLGLVDPNDGTGRLFIYDQAGTVTILQNGIPLPTPFLDVSSRLVPLGIVQGIDIKYDERGLLGFALSPQFATNGKVYTFTCEPVSGPADFTIPKPAGESFDSQSVIAEWTVSASDSNVIDPSTRRELFRFDQPQFNHKGGNMKFGPDGYLYIGSGDGGAEGDFNGYIYFGQPSWGHDFNGNGQNNQTLIGKMLRIDVNGTNSANGKYGIPPDNPFVGGGGLAEIYATGLRNPYSFSFDSATGDLWVGDVGQNDLEEVDVVTKGGNYGWRFKEGTFYFQTDPNTGGLVVTVPPQPIPSGLIDPVAEYDHDEGHAVIGGHVYRGALIPDLVGHYVFADLGNFGSPSGRLFYLDASNQINEFRIGTDDHPLGYWAKGFGEDHNGDLYLLASGSITPFGNLGVVLKIVGLTTADVKSWTLYN